jgi:type IV pilus assembly protein PilC
VYLWKGRTTAGEIQTGELTFDSQDEVLAALRKKRIIITSVREKPRDLKFTLPKIGSGVSTRDLAIFTRQFATMINAGLPLVQCLDILSKQTEKEDFRAVIAQTMRDVEAGTTLAEALAKKENNKVFDELFVNMVEAGEAGGILDDILQRLATFIEKAEGAEAEDPGGHGLPGRGHDGRMSRDRLHAHLHHSDLCAHVHRLRRRPAASDQDRHGPLVVPALLLVGDARRNRGRHRDDPPLLHHRAGAHADRQAPAQGAGPRRRHPEGRRRSLHAHARNPDLLGRADLDRARDHRPTAGNRVVQEAIMAARASIREGETISAPLKQSNVFPPMVVQMISVGEETGALDDMLTRIADFYDSEVDTAVDALTSLIEPVMIVFMGAVVGGMVIAMYLPMFKLINVVAGGH